MKHIKVTLPIFIDRIAINAPRISIAALCYWLVRHKIDPSVSVPSDTVTGLAEVDIVDPSNL
ncbi:hypothetical protein JHK82_028060 [Glycine max]|nr:hypothetical protein JHK82_028060 [Glycine max]